VATRLKGGEVLELQGDLGSGKTTFTKGLLRGLGYKGAVPSPTFTISRVYSLKSGLELHHYDFYRLHTGDVATTELKEVLGKKDYIAVIEWAGNSGLALPSKTIKIHFSLGVKEGDRNIEISAPDNSELMRELANA
jgi:tRNA threonylcarbamoyladenosine biosynthesis protein TsaE